MKIFPSINVIKGKNAWAMETPHKDLFIKRSICEKTMDTSRCGKKPPNEDDVIIVREKEKAKSDETKKKAIVVSLPCAKWELDSSSKKSKLVSCWQAKLNDTSKGGI